MAELEKNARINNKMFKKFVFIKQILNLVP